jgi:hypothetical protein
MNSNSLQIEIDRNRYFYFLVVSSLLFIAGFTLLKASPDGLVSSWDELLLYWSMHIVSAMLIYYFCTTTYFKWIGRQKNLLLHFFIGSFMGGLLFGGIAGVLEFPFRQEPFSWLTYIVHMPEEVMSAGSQSFIFWILIHLAFVRSGEKREYKFSAEHETVQAHENAPNEVSTVYVVKSEGNYLKIFYADSTSMQLGVLRDFSKENPQGCQIHRSYWVNSSCVERLVSVKGRKFVFMKNGLQVPIGRTHSESGVIDKLMSKNNIQFKK